MKKKNLFQFAPVALPSGKGFIVNEMCICGALKTEHLPHFSPGHGPCLRTGCPKFTWDHFITVEVAS